MADQQLSTSSSSTAFQGFNQLASSLTDALQEFKKLQTSEGVVSLLGVLKPILQQGRHALTVTTSYARRHPARIAITVAALGFLVAAMNRPTKAKELLH